MYDIISEFKKKKLLYPPSSVAIHIRSNTSYNLLLNKHKPARKRVTDGGDDAPNKK